MIFQIRLKNNTVNFRVICPLINTPSYWAAYGQRKTTNKNKKARTWRQQLSFDHRNLNFLSCHANKFINCEQHGGADKKNMKSRRLKKVTAAMYDRERVQCEV